ncbi:MAG: hypothetical protein RR403_06420 [Pseudoflavonifractor sp.]
MFRSLHMKLVLIMVLLIVSLMTVVGAFLINSVSAFYQQDFYAQMEEVFSGADLARALQSPAEEGQTEAEYIQNVLKAYRGAMGVDNRNRNYFILDDAGRYLEGSDDEQGRNLKITNNISRALGHKSGSASDRTASYMDVAVPLQRGDAWYVIYVLDNRQTVQSLNTQLFQLILEALVFGLRAALLPAGQDHDYAHRAAHRRGGAGGPGGLFP